jgi:diguanylate cyclase (GGDEF)-like protein
VSTLENLLLAAAIVLQAMAALYAIRALPHRGAHRYLWMALALALVLMVPRRGMSLVDEHSRAADVASAALAVVVSALLASSMAGLGRLMRDMHDRERDLERLATTDALTGVANRREALAALARALEGAARTGRPVALLMIDVDRFKRVNDDHGHEAGDRVLAAVANRCRTGLRVVDTCGRVGGEEFVVVLPDTDARGATVAAERLREAVERAPIDPVGVTVSVGVAVHPPRASGDGSVRAADAAAREAEALLRRADAALYRAKALGRNRVVSDAPDDAPAGQDGGAPR